MNIIPRQSSRGRAFGGGQGQWWGLGWKLVSPLVWQQPPRWGSSWYCRTQTLVLAQPEAAAAVQALLAPSPPMAISHPPYSLSTCCWWTLELNLPSLSCSQPNSTFTRTLLRPPKKFLPVQPAACSRLSNFDLSFKCTALTSRGPQLNKLMNACTPTPSYLHPLHRQRESAY